MLFTSLASDATSFEDGAIEVVDVKTGERRVVHRGGYYARYVSTGHILYVHEATLFALAEQLEGADRGALLTRVGIACEEQLGRERSRSLRAREKLIADVEALAGVEDLHEALEQLEALYPETPIPLDHTDPFTLLVAVDNGYQAALMVPTEILAEQHWQNFHSWFAPLSIDMQWLSGRTKGKKRTDALARIASGEAAPAAAVTDKLVGCIR